MKRDIADFVLNHIVTHIPVWVVRKTFYQLFGMKIGKHSRILMGTRILAPWKIAIGDRSYINEYCVLDGRGGLAIGNDVNISMFSTILTASHSKTSNTFEYREGRVQIDDHVWLGARAIVLDNSHIANKSIISAGSVYKGTTKENWVYSGVPAEPVCFRNLLGEYSNIWKPVLR